MLRNLTCHYSKDLVSLRKNYGELLGITQNVPLPLNLDLVLVPLKMRYPQFEKDGATGYVNVCAVESLTTLPDHEKAMTPEVKCIVQLNGGKSLACLISKRFTDKRLINGRLALSHYKSLHGYKKNTGLDPASGLVMEKASSDALDKIVTFSRILYELLTDDH